MIIVMMTIYQDYAKRFVVSARYLHCQNEKLSFSYRKILGKIVIHLNVTERYKLNMIKIKKNGLEFEHEYGHPDNTF